MHNINEIAVLDEFKNTPDRYYITIKAIQKIFNYLQTKHGKYVDNEELLKYVISQERCEKFYIMQKMLKHNVTKKTYIGHIAYKFHKGIIKVDNNVTMGVGIQIYEANVKNIKIKNWKKLGYKSQLKDITTYKEAFNLGMFFANDRTFKWTCGAINGVETAKVENWKKVIDFNRESLTIMMSTLLSLQVYDQYKKEEIMLTAEPGENDQNKQTTRPPKKVDPFNLKHIHGNEHIMYERYGSKIYDEITGDIYRSIAFTCRKFGFEYWPFYHRVSDGKDPRFKRIN